jgi:tetratricopeptide (TPR) repeat protein
MAELALQVARAQYLSRIAERETLRWFDRAVGLAEAVQDHRLLVRSLSSYAGALMVAGRPTMGLGLLQVALDVSRRHGLIEATLAPLNNLIAFLVTRDLPAARGYTDEAITLVRRIGDQGMAPFLHPNCFITMALTGEWDAALAFFREKHSDEQPLVITELALIAYVRQIQAARGDALEALPLDELVPGPDAPNLSCYHLYLQGQDGRAAGDFAGAAKAFGEAVARYVVLAGIDDDFAAFWIEAVEASIDAGDLEEARRQLALVGDAAPGNVTTFLRGQHYRLQAQLAVAAGEVEGVDELMVQAIESLRQFGAPFYLARALLNRAEWLIASGAEAATAQPLLDEAQRIFVHLRARPWIDRTTNAQTLVVS